ncbi:2-keto-3-deoxygluconate permease [Longispora sp. NPDC051575]|uniref:2-keto-3-deoxygluconate permease n=1 Tax=Longispora sp. NPDC051575 TaxID=3154943 RepID=UPI0034221773
MTAISRIAGLPGAPILVPLLIGASLGTVTGGTDSLGPVTRALLSGFSLPCIAVLMFAVGAQVSVRSLAPVAGRTVLILAGTSLVPGALILVYAWMAGPEGIGGVPLLTLLAVGLSSSYGLWAALASRYGTTRDLAAGCMAAVISSGPVLPLILVMAWRGGSAAVPWRLLIDAVAPVVAGIALGHLLPAARQPLKGVIAPLLPLLALSLGWAIPLRALLTQAPAGIALAVAGGLLSGGLVALAFRLVLRRPAGLGWAAGAAAANSAAMPLLLAEGDATWRPYVVVASAQAAVAVLAGTILATAVTALTARRGSTHDPEQLPDLVVPGGRPASGSRERITAGLTGGVR